MNNPMKRLLPVAVSLILAACAAPPPPPPVQPKPTIVVAPPPPVDTAEQQTLRTLLSLQERIDRVTAPLLVNNAEICKKNARKLLGFAAKNKYSFSEDLADTAQRAFGFNDRLQITHVLAGSGAARVGLQRGDVLLAVEGMNMPQGANAERNAAGILYPLVQKRSALQLTVQRNGSTTTLEVPLTLSCAFIVGLGNADLVNAFADGRRIAITRGLVNFAQTDDELAYIVAREMAHNILGHAAKQRMTATMAGIIDNLIRVHPDLSMMTGTSGVKPYRPDLDAEADRLSMYLALRAGYNIEQATRFWQRLAEQYPAAQLNSYTAIHPATAQRLAALDKASVDIHRKQATGRPLLP